MELLQKIRVVVFGLGGVGSWCAEALVRSGIRNLTLVDSDVVCVTNINRQLQATCETIGKAKADLLRERFLQINPHASITALQAVFNKQSADEFNLGSYDYIIDAIDSLSNKVELIIRGSSAGGKIFTALGASNKIDPTRIKISSLWDSNNCHLGRFVRKRLRRRGFTSEVTCVYSDELLDSPAEPQFSRCGSDHCHCPKKETATSLSETDDPQVDSTAVSSDWCSKKKQVNGSAVHITAIFGFMLAGLVIQDVTGRLRTSDKSPLRPISSEE
ncbi:MAG: ThiF family adenylyltransferase [Chitinivibrionales bacterium]|nr:ThiF family adenylyltransferase [Chitinivibrionales bacterium]